MRDRLRNLAFPSLLLVLALAGLYLSMDWGFRTRIFPVVVAIALAIFSAAEIVNVLVRRPRRAPGGTPAREQPSGPPVAPDQPVPEPRRSGGTTEPTPVVVATPRPETAEAAADLAGESRVSLRTGAITAVWLAAYTGALYVLGFLVAGVVMTFVYMTVGRREGWWPSALMAAGAGAVIWVLQTYAGMQVARGLLWERM